jgi:hypothetical protein
MSDTRLRQLERLAALGDPQAEAAFVRLWERCGKPENFLASKIAWDSVVGGIKPPTVERTRQILNVLWYRIRDDNPLATVSVFSRDIHQPGKKQAQRQARRQKRATKKQASSNRASNLNFAHAREQRKGLGIGLGGWSYSEWKLGRCADCNELANVRRSWKRMQLNCRDCFQKPRKKRKKTKTSKA